jgi:negative regulator of replication initiation
MGREAKMKTTIEMDDELYRQVKVRTAQLGITMKDLIQAALRKELAVDEKPAQPRHVKFPLLDPVEGAPTITSEQVYQALNDIEEEEAERYARFIRR